MMTLGEALKRGLERPPEALAADIRAACIRAEAVARRRRIVLMAAACAALVAVALAWASTRPLVQDPVVVAPGRTASVTPTPTPGPSPSPSPSPGPMAATTYYTRAGTYFHLAEDCLGMRGAEAHDMREALLSGKKPCPTCFDSAGKRELYRLPWPAEDSDEVVFQAGASAYYHRDFLCFNMTAPRLGTLAEARALGLKACPNCLDRAGSGVTVYVSAGDGYYHRNAGCPELAEANPVSEAEARAAYKIPCPVCASQEPEGHGLFLAAFGQGLEVLYPEAVYTRTVLGRWLMSDGESEWEACAVGRGADGFANPPPCLDAACTTLSVDFGDRATMRRFMKGVCEPLQGLYREAPRVVKRLLKKRGMLKRKEDYWLQGVRVGFDRKGQQVAWELSFAFLRPITLTWQRGEAGFEPYRAAMERQAR